MNNAFRAKSVSSQGMISVGRVSIASPVRLSLLVYLFTFIALLTIGYFIWGTYTRRVTVQGYVQPAGDVIRLYSPQNGVLLKRLVHEGQPVLKGTTLFTISSERQSNTGPTQGRITQSLQDRLLSYQQSLFEQRGLSQLQSNDLQQRLQMINSEIKQANKEQSILQQRLQLAQQTRQRFECKTACKSDQVSGVISVQF